MRITGARRCVGVIVMSLCASLLTTLLVATSDTPQASAQTGAVAYGVGSTSVSTPASGSRYIYVSTSGSDTHTEFKANWSVPQNWTYNRLSCLTNPNWKRDSTQEACPEPSRDNPLRTIKTAIRAAAPGDVIVVRGGTYREAVGWGAISGTSSKPIVLQAQPGETVTLSGTLQLKNVDHWRVQGIRFVYNASIQGTGQAVVQFVGGRNWSFINNEVRDSRGVANLMVNAGKPASTATAPHNYTIAGNCIHSQAGTGSDMSFHNIYLLSSVYSTGGIVERNLLANAPNGANIKAAGPSQAAAVESPRDVTIRFNTMLYGRSGVTLGLAAEKIVLDRNIIAFANNSGEYHGGIKTYKFAKPLTSIARDSVVSRYNKVLEEDGGVTQPLPTRDLLTDHVSLTGSLTGCTASVNPAWVRHGYGHLAATRDGSFIDDNLNTHEGAIEAIRTAGITYGCNPPAQTRYCPSADITREQMAAFLRRGLNLPDASRDYFRDDSTSTFQRDINALRAAGITYGCNPPKNDRFCPKDTVTREQMAAFLTRAFNYPATTKDYFSDDNRSTFQASINSLASAGITYGCNPPTNTKFCPRDPVKRDQMASFFARALDLKAPPPR